MPKRKIKVTVGDVFAIKLDENGTFGYGQVVARGRYPCWMVAYDMVGKGDHLAVEYIVSKPIIFIINAVDSVIEDGIWKIIGNTQVPAIQYPTFKVDTPKGYVLIDHLGEVINKDPAPAELEGLTGLISRSPATFAKALKARYVTGEWDPYYDRIVYHP